MMQKFNKENTYIFNTIQLYRKDRIEYLKELIAHARKESFFIGVKLVRGAYHEKELERADKIGYTCPVHKKKMDTDKDYNKAIEMDSSYADAYANRGVSKYYIENKKGACEDWTKAVEMGVVNAAEALEEHCKK